MSGLIYRRMLGLAKVETVVGTDAVPTAALDSLLLRDVTYTPDVQQLERPLMLADISNTAQRPGRKTVTITFSVEIKGSGVVDVAPKIGRLLMGCGFAETKLALEAGFRYDPVSSDFTSLTLYLYIDGILHKVTGARGSFNITAAAGEYALCNFTFNGNFIKPTDAALPSPITYEESLPPIVENAELEVQGYSACAANFTIDTANTINPRLCVNAEGGVNGYNLTARNVTGSFDPEASLMAEYDPFQKLIDGAVGDYRAVIGKEDWNVCVIKGNVQYTNVTPGEREGALIWDIPVRFVRKLGNDEISLTFPKTATP